MRKEYTLDRVEGDIAVCVSRDDGKCVEICSGLLFEAGVSEGGIFSADIDGDLVSNIECLASETEKVKSALDSRLSRLFNRRKENEE